MSPEARARQRIDELLGAAGWHVCDFKAADMHVARGVAVREFELAAGHGTADYLLYADGRTIGVNGNHKTYGIRSAMAKRERRLGPATGCRGSTRPPPTGASGRSTRMPGTNPPISTTAACSRPTRSASGGQFYSFSKR